MNPDQQLNPQELQRLNEAIFVTADAIRRVAPHLGGQLGSLFGQQPQFGGQQPFGAAGMGQPQIAHQIAEAVRMALEQSGGAWQQGGGYPIVERIVEGIRNALAFGQNSGMGAMGGFGQMGSGQMGSGQMNYGQGYGQSTGHHQMGGHPIVERIVEVLRNTLGQSTQSSGFGGFGGMGGNPVVDRILETLRSTLGQSGQQGGYNLQQGGYGSSMGGQGWPKEGYGSSMGGQGWQSGGGNPMVDRIVDAIRNSLTQGQSMGGGMFGQGGQGGVSPFVNLQQRGI